MLVPFHVYVVSFLKCKSNGQCSILSTLSIKETLSSESSSVHTRYASIRLYSLHSFFDVTWINIDAQGQVVPRTYMMFYVGDYDSASWLYNMLKQNWDDPARGTVPLGWAVDPNLSVRFPLIFDCIKKGGNGTTFDKRCKQCV